MPAALPPQRLSWERHAAVHIHDASRRHPVFFTDKLQRLVYPATLGPPVLAFYPQVSPVAQGYVYQDGSRRSDMGSAGASKL